MTLGLHIYRCDQPTRTRTRCPYHNRLCYGERQDFYDTSRIFFDCGTFADYGYGYYEPPKLYKTIKIFNDENGYTASTGNPCWVILARQTSLNVARGIAKKRLKKGGRIDDRTLIPTHKGGLAE